MNGYYRPARRHKLQHHSSWPSLRENARTAQAARVTLPNATRAAANDSQWRPNGANGIPSIRGSELEDRQRREAVKQKMS